MLGHGDRTVDPILDQLPVPMTHFLLNHDLDLVLDIHALDS